MAFFEDLTSCSYFTAKELPTLVAIGWLERGYPYTKGDPGADVHQRLDELRGGQWQPLLFMGFHACDLCAGPESRPLFNDGAFSHKNLFVPGPGVTYVAPEGIAHYVRRHHYHPPGEFCDALLSAPRVDSPEYFEALRRLGWPERLLRPRSMNPAGTRS
jgi:hypothetical protein